MLHDVVFASHPRLLAGKHVGGILTIISNIYHLGRGPVRRKLVEAPPHLLHRDLLVPPTPVARRHSSRRGQVVAPPAVPEWWRSGGGYSGCLLRDGAKWDDEDDYYDSRKKMATQKNRDVFVQELIEENRRGMGDGEVEGKKKKTTAEVLHVDIARIRARVLHVSNFL
ncbi:hypothetical protein Vadar_017804 [Vaccinium darrowii]|uniref:Uncharacterized protein n=1 Tax=Vaccinium darrowii TaxID=229202 RepID=A0ACB7Y7Y0_9ERIC|nr:hypothetical protein Vadar_017804 [Vaccinium darrowii]